MEPETCVALMVSPSFASATACRSEPGPLSFVFVTVMVFACALAAASHEALKQPASRILQLFTSAEFSVDFVTRQAGKRNCQYLEQVTWRRFRSENARLFFVWP
jgi:hypothetical protein